MALFDTPPGAGSLARTCGQMLCRSFTGPFPVAAAAMAFITR